MLVKTKSIQQTFLMVIIPLVVITLLVSFFFLSFINQRSEYVRLGLILQNRLQNQALLLANPIWNVDEERAYDVVRVLVQNEDVAGAAVFDEEGKEFTSVGILQNMEFTEIAESSKLGINHHSDLISALSNLASSAKSRDFVGSTSISFNSDAGEKAIGTLFIAVSDNKIRQQIRNNLIDYATLSVLTLFILLGGSYYAYRFSVGRPLNIMTKIITRAKAGQPREEILWSSEDEVGRLIDSFNELQTKQAQYESDLNTSLKMTESSNRTKSEFLAKMSHELRTPLNAIIGINELLYEDAKEANNKSQIEPLTRVLSAGDHLLGLINEILDLSIIEAGKLVLTYEQIDLNDLLKDVINTVRPLAEKEGNELTTDLADPKTLMEIDPKRLKQILINLLGNACKFTSKGKVELKVWFDSRYEEKICIFRISDNGIGITQEQLSKLFVSFQQGDDSVTRQFGGAGLGLAISKQLCEVMGGDITVSSRIGKGSTFTVTLPMIQASKLVPESDS